MKKISMILFLIVSALFIISPMAVNAGSDPLMKYMWKNRLVVYSISESDAGNFDVSKVAAENRDELEDRDMLLFDLNGKDKGDMFGELETGEMTSLKKAYGIGDDRSVFILVGKDGGEKERLVGNLDLQYFFDRIDSMPMRMEEMGE